MSSNPTAWVKYEELSDNGGRFVISPLSRGMGTTIGNSLRRVLLSSLSGFAVSAVKIDGVKHEFSTVPGVVEDVLDIINNLKGVVMVSSTDEPVEMRLSAKSKGKLTAKDIELPGSVSIVNPDLYLLELSESVPFNMTIHANYGTGYCPTEEQQGGTGEVDEIKLDSSYSPIVKVNHRVENTRVGKELGYDSLTLDVWTNGSVTAEDAVKSSANILLDQFQLFGSINEAPVEEAQQEEASSDEQLKETAMNLTIDDLELSARSSNCLKRAGIENVAELIALDVSELIKIKNFGKKSADEINSKLSNYNLALKGNVE